MSTTNAPLYRAMGHCAATDLPVARSVMCSQYPSYTSTTVSYSLGLPFAGQPHLAYMQELAFALKGVRCTVCRRQSAPIRCHSSIGATIPYLTAETRFPQWLAEQHQQPNLSGQIPIRAQQNSPRWLSQCTRRPDSSRSLTLHRAL